MIDSLVSTVLPHLAALAAVMCAALGLFGTARIVSRRSVSVVADVLEATGGMCVLVSALIAVLAGATVLARIAFSLPPLG